MPSKINPTQDNTPLQQLLQSTDEGVKDLFIRVMNLHAGYQIEERSSAQLTAEVRKAIEISLEDKTELSDKTVLKRRR